MTDGLTDPQSIPPISADGHTIRTSSEPTNVHYELGDSLADLECVRLLQRVWPRPAAEAPHPDSAPEPATADEATAPMYIGRFRIERLLGHGGFGVVWLATDPDLDRQVALKIPQPHILVTPELHERFVQEARAAAMLDHPHIVPIHEINTSGPVSYIAAAYCPGTNLEQWIAQQTAEIPVDTAAELVALLAEAMQYSHERGVLHCDLKPSNVLVVPHEPASAPANVRLPFTPRLTDFGLAKLLEQSLLQTRTSMVLGTPAYMAPEQAKGKLREIDARTDVYALGAILYQLLTHRPVVDGETTFDILERVRNQEPVPPSRIRSSVPRDLEIICLKCLQKDPLHRYQTAGELAADLRRFLNGEPIAGRPLSLAQRFGRWVRRPQRVRDAGLVIAMVNVGVALWTVISTAALIIWNVVPTDVPGQMMLQAVALASVLHLPLVFLGWKIANGSRGALHLTFGIITALALFLVACLEKWVTPPFGTAYNDSFALTTVFILLLIMSIGQLILLTFAWIGGGGE